MRQRSLTTPANTHTHTAVFKCLGTIHVCKTVKLVCSTLNRVASSSAAIDFTADVKRFGFTKTTTKIIEALGKLNTDGK